MKLTPVHELSIYEFTVAQLVVELLIFFQRDVIAVILMLVEHFVLVVWVVILTALNTRWCDSALMLFHLIN